MSDITKIKVADESESSFKLYPRNSEFAKRADTQPDWNQNDPSQEDYIENKPLIATNDDAMDFLAEMGMITPVTNSNGEILISPSNEIYSL